jgi:hypothetical protein
MPLKYDRSDGDRPLAASVARFGGETPARPLDVLYTQPPMGLGARTVRTPADFAAKGAPSSMPADGPGRHAERVLGAPARSNFGILRSAGALQSQQSFGTATSEISKMVMEQNHLGGVSRET